MDKLLIFLLFNTFVSNNSFIFLFNSSVTSIFNFLILLFRLNVTIRDVIRSLTNSIIRIIPIIVNVFLFIFDNISVKNGLAI